MITLLLIFLLSVVFSQAPIKDDRNQENSTKKDQIREAPTNALNAKVITVETAVFIDLALFHFYEKIYPQDTEAQILILFLAYINGMQQLYNDGSLSDKRISFVVIKFEIIRNETLGSFHGGTFLNNFFQWQSLQNVPDDNDPRHWDYALLFTGSDFDAEGVASSDFCGTRSSATLNNGRGFDAVFIATHETGHTFGIRHDIVEKGCPPPANFIMSGGLHVRPWSPCSKARFNAFLNSSRSLCLLDEPQPTPKYDHERNNNIWFGQCYDLDQQCEINRGPGFIKSPYQTPDKVRKVGIVQKGTMNSKLCWTKMVHDCKNSKGDNHGV